MKNREGTLAPTKDDSAVILIVDDCPEDRQRYQGLIQGHTGDAYCFLAEDTWEAGLERLRSERVDVLLLADHLGINALSVLKNISESHDHYHIPVILLTDQWDEADLVQAMKAGAADTLDKNNLSRELLSRAVQHAVDRKRNELELLDFHEAIQESRNMIAIYDRNYVYRAANKSYLENRRLRREEVIGKNIIDVLGEKTFNQIIKPHMERCFMGEFVTYEMSMSHHEKGKQHLEVAYHPIKDGGTGVRRVVAIIEDITARKRAEDLRRDRERLEAVIETAGAVCHELNQPLQVLSGLAELMIMNVEKESSLSEMAKKIKFQTDRLAEITNKLMTITRYETKDYLKGKIIDIDRASHSDERAV